MTFNNSGTAHKILKQTSIKLTPMDGGKKVKDEMKEYIPDALNGVINILAKVSVLYNYMARRYE